MSEGLQKLQDIGAQKIHERTHISREHIQALLHGSFDDFSKIQFLGFLSILEREYEINLDDVKADGTKYFDEKKPSHNAGVFVVAKRTKSYKKRYIFIVILIVLIAIGYTMYLSSQKVDLNNIDNTSIENATTNIEVNNDVNTTTPITDEVAEDTNQTLEPQLLEPQLKDDEEPVVKKEEVQKEEKKVVKSFKIFPKSKLWMGYMDLSTHKKYQKLFKKEFDLDPEKDWLLSLGHGYVNFEIDGKIKKFSTKKNMRFIYKNNELKKISLKEFKRLNRGNRW